MNKDIYLCAISNVKSGKCSEDCSFCTQSAHHNINIDTYGFKSVEVVVEFDSWCPSKDLPHWKYPP